MNLHRISSGKRMATMMGNFGNFGMWGWGGMILNLVVLVALLIGLVLLIVWAVKRVGGNPTSNIVPTTGNPTAREIAQTRYAKGEINREEYQQILSDLGK
jgi:putative membrane protein